MSRTVRRKGKTPPEWVTHDYVRTSRRISNCGKYWFSDWQWVSYEGKELDKSIALYYNDNRQGEFSPPADFVRTYFTKKQRSRQRNVLRKMINTGDYENYYFNPHKKSAGWDWW